MMQWLADNKEWLFSGGGLVFVSFISIFFTSWAKNRNERKKKKILKVDKESSYISLPGAENIDSNNLKVSYKDKVYDSLCLYSVTVENIGLIPIENQNLVFSIPHDVSVIDTFLKANLNAITSIDNEAIVDDRKDITYTINRLESNDRYKISLLVNISNVSQLSLKPRGVDNIEYVYGNMPEKSEKELILYGVAVFIAVSQIPIIGGILMATLIIVYSQKIIKFIDSYYKSKKESNTIDIGSLHIEKEGSINILQKES